MKVVAIVCMIISVLFFALGLFTGWGQSNKLYIDESIYLVGGGLMFVLSALLFVANDLRETIEDHLERQARERKRELERKAREGFNQ